MAISTFFKNLFVETGSPEPEKLSLDEIRKRIFETSRNMEMRNREAAAAETKARAALQKTFQPGVFFFDLRDEFRCSFEEIRRNRLPDNVFIHVIEMDLACPLQDIPVIEGERAGLAAGAAEGLREMQLTFQNRPVERESGDIPPFEADRIVFQQFPALFEQRQGFFQGIHVQIGKHAGTGRIHRDE